MLSLRTLALGVAVLLVGASVSQPAAAQGRSGVSSLTHVVSVTVPARVKVKVSSVSLMSSGSVPAAVKVSTAPSASVNGLALSIHANKAWVLSVSASAAEAAKTSKILWSGTQTGEFKPITHADTLLATGTQSPAAVDTTVFFRSGKSGVGATAAPVLLTVSAP